MLVGCLNGTFNFIMNTKKTIKSLKIIVWVMFILGQLYIITIMAVIAIKSAKNPDYMCVLMTFGAIVLTIVSCLSIAYFVCKYIKK